MSNSLIPAFNQIRLTNEFVSVSGLRVKVANDNTLMVRDSGNFANVQNLTGLSGYLMSQIGFAAGGVTSVNSISGNITIAGTGNTSAFTIGQTVYISGNNNDALNLSGYISNVSGGLDARIRATGQAAWQAGQNNALNLSGNLAQTGALLDQTINTLSGNLTTTGQTLVNLINGLSGQLNLNNYISYINATGFITGVNINSDYQYIHFPRPFARIPQVQLTMDTISDTGNIYYFCGTSKRSTTGFFANFSDTIQETGLVLSVWASI